MITDIAPTHPTPSDIDESAASLQDRAEALRDKASELMHEGVEFAKGKPYVTAAVVGGVAAAAAAAVYGGTKLYQHNGKDTNATKAKGKAKD